MTPQSQGKGPGWAWGVLAILVGIVVLLAVLPLSTASSATKLDYSDFMTRVDNGQVATAKVSSNGAVEGTLRDGTKYTTQIPTAVAGPDQLADRLAKGNVTVEGKAASTDWLTIFLTLAPVVLIIGMIVWMSRRASSAGGMGISAFARSKAKVIAEQRPSVRFEDVAGYDGVKQELREVLDFLRSPERFARVGAKGPTGILMTGPPGTGKTLFARALAGEASVPFLSVTGSAFVELFVGVGAARVRDLFEQARRMAPAIVFIDEIDAVGQRRGGHVFGSNDEREQTVNQLLAEMDGFDPSSGVVVLAATNRPDVLDPALLRPGRFDRQIVVPLPNRDERAAILGVHCKGKPLDPGFDIQEFARATPGFSGADLANLANEAAIHAVRAGRDVILRDDFESAHDRVVLGRRDGSTILLPDERRSVAAHEAGHALVAALSPGADPVARVTILPSGPALGATHQLPLDDRHLYPESYLRTSLAVLLGGRAGELVAIGEVSSGAADDLAKATEISTRMVRELGMSSELGPIGYGGSRSFLGGADDFAYRPFADSTQRLIDTEVARLVGTALERAVALLTQHHRSLERVMAMLLEEETIDGDRLYELLGKEPPTATDTAPRLGVAAARRLRPV